VIPAGIQKDPSWSASSSPRLCNLFGSNIATRLKFGEERAWRTITNVTILQRSVARIDHTTVKTGMTPVHRVRRSSPPVIPKATDPFLLLMEDWFPRGVFDRHPHRGMETVAYVIDGQLDHYDNYGNQGSLLPGNVQWMTAGRGIIHNEQPRDGVTVHSLQLWVNLPRCRQDGRTTNSKPGRCRSASAARAGR
jgi:hypothetical protein